MERGSRPVPAQTFKRLPAYYNLLLEFRREGYDSVSSPMIAKRLGLHEVQVKKDLSSVSEAGGRPRTGFSVGDLIVSIGRRLGCYDENAAVLVGAGQLGRALLSYEGIREYGVRILAGFDNDDAVIGLEKGGKPVLDIATLGHFCRKHGVRIGIITVPAAAAQHACDLFVASGIIAIWNFAPVHLNAPDGVFVHNENMAASLSLISRHLAHMDDLLEDRR